jgi:hypothetical protein
MLVFRLRWHAEGAASALWFGTRREAEREQARLRLEEGVDAAVDCLEIPRSKQGMLAWLNAQRGTAADVTQDAA